MGIPLVLTEDREVPEGELLVMGQARLEGRVLQGKEIEAVIMVDNIILVEAAEQVPRVLTGPVLQMVVLEF
jgi:hypothetical protein